jgi:hypothetical protein
MRVSIKRSFGSLLVAGVLTVGSLSPSFARGGGGGVLEGYFPGITDFTGGAPDPGASGGFQAREPDSRRPRSRSCDTHGANARPLYCR